MSDVDFDRAGALIDKAALGNTLADLVNIPSPTGQEAAVAAYIVGRLSKAGLEANLQFVDTDRPNATGVLPGSGGGCNLLFTGHMDTSYSGDEEFLSGDGFTPVAVQRDGWIWGLGARNMKGGLAAALVAVEAIAKSGIQLAGDVTFGGVVGEIEKAPVEEFQGPSFSGYGIGSKHLVTHGVTGDYAILMEPTNLRICTANMGCIWARITVRGTIAHAALTNKPGIVNAVTLMNELQNDLAGWAKAYEQSCIYMGERPNVTISAIRGGVPWRLSRNPVSCDLYLDIRTVPGQSIEDVKRDLRLQLGNFAQRKGCREPELFLYVTDPATMIDEDTPIVDALDKAQRAVSGNRPASIMRRPGADAVHLNVYGVPCAVFGPGGRLHPDIGTRPRHEFGEHVHVDDLYTAACIYLRTMLDVCNRPSPSPL